MPGSPKKTFLREKLFWIQTSQRGEDGLPFVGVVFALIAYCLDLPMESELIPSLKKIK
jgi:hypothetical protein